MVFGIEKGNFWGFFTDDGEDRGRSNSWDKAQEELISDFKRQMPGAYSHEARQSYSETPRHSKCTEKLSTNARTKAPKKAQFHNDAPTDTKLIDFDAPCPSDHAGTYAKQSDQMATVANNRTREPSTQGYYNLPGAQQPYYQTLEANSGRKGRGMSPDDLAHFQKISLEKTTIEQTLDNERTENKKLKQAIQTLKGTSQRSHMEIKALKRALAEAQAENEGLKEANEKLKDKIFEVQPVIQFSDSQIGEKYHLICSHIEDWIESEIPDLGGVVHKLTRHIVQTERLKLLMKTLWGSRDWEMLTKFPEAEYSILRRIIHVCLELWIFDSRIYLVGIDGVGGEMLAQIEQGMRSLEPRVDEETIQAWRSNSLRALATVPNYVEHRETYLRRATSFVETLLEPLFLDNHNVQRSMDKFHTRVTVLAADLMTILRTNPDRYYFNNRSTNLTVNTVLNLHKRDLESLIMIDVETDQAVKTLAFRSLDDGAWMGRELVVIHPALMREAKGDNPDILIRKPVCLVRLGKRLKQQSA